MKNNKKKISSELNENKKKYFYEIENLQQHIEYYLLNKEIKNNRIAEQTTEQSSSFKETNITNYFFTNGYGNLFIGDINYKANDPIWDSGYNIN